jgi:hypothetical protein
LKKEDAHAHPLFVSKSHSGYCIVYPKQSLKKSPRHAVCSAVLNLLSQVGFRLRSSALAEAYRVTAADVKPYKQVLAQNRSCGITRTAGYLFYTII